jgi:hypothetical protein
VRDKRALLEKLELRRRGVKAAMVKLEVQLAREAEVGWAGALAQSGLALSRPGREKANVHLPGVPLSLSGWPDMVPPHAAAAP